MTLLFMHLVSHQFEVWMSNDQLTSSLQIPSLLWRHNGLDCVSNHQPHECLLNRSVGCRSKKTSKLRVTGLCVGNSPETGEFPAQMASNAENVIIRWRHHADGISLQELGHQLPSFEDNFNIPWIISRTIHIIIYNHWANFVRKDSWI